MVELHAQRVGSLEAMQRPQRRGDRGGCSRDQVKRARGEWSEEERERQRGRKERVGIYCPASRDPAIPLLALRPPGASLILCWPAPPPRQCRCICTRSRACRAVDQLALVDSKHFIVAFVRAVYQKSYMSVRPGAIARCIAPTSPNCRRASRQLA